MSKWFFEDQGVRFAIGAMRLAMNQLAEMRKREQYFRAENIGGVRCEWVWSQTTEHAECITIYLHGGGYVAGSPASHFKLATLLSAASNSRVLLIDYRLAPEHQYPAQLNDALAVYRALLASGIDIKKIALAGDSAGGNLALALLLRLRELHLPLPVAFVSYSPWTDLTNTNESIQRNAQRDIAIPVSMLDPLAKMFAGDNDVRDPFISPLFADLHGLPPMQIHAAQDEVLLDDSVHLAEKVHAAGGIAECHIWSGVTHAFPVFAEAIADGRMAIAQSGDFLRRHFLSAARSSSID